MPTVCNSSPIIHLTKIGLLEILQDLFGQILVPEMVFEECTNSIHHQDEVGLIKKARWIHVQRIGNHNLFNLLHADIDAGEAEALVLALETNADLVLLDDQQARFKAKKLGLPVAGTVGVLLKARKKGLITSVSKHVQQLQNTGFWLSPALLSRIPGCEYPEH